MDYRYSPRTVAQLVETYGINDVLFCNNVSMTRAGSLVSKLYNNVG